MKKRLCVVMFVFFLLAGCRKTTDVLVSKREAFQISVDVNVKNKMIIPDPADSKSVNNILINPELMEDDNNMYLTDLTFAGVKEKVKITAYEIGYVISKDNSFGHIVYSDSVEDRKKSSDSPGIRNENIPGNCLILSASSKSDAKGSDDARHYIIVLDYINKKSYSVETSLAVSWNNHPVISISDLTGDGLTDIIVSNVLNGYRSGTSCEIFSFYGDGLKKIYSNIDFKDDYFTGHLEDDYKVVIKCRQNDFTKEVDLLDIGYRKRDLEISEAPSGEIGDETQFCRCYQNGKIKKNNLAENVYAAALDDVDGIQLNEEQNAESSIRFKYNMYMGKWNDIGSAYAYMQYNKSKKYMEIVKASFEPAELR